jgi:hypothetical protein
MDEPIMIRLSDVATHNRMDANFHIAVRKIAGEADRLRMHYPASEAKRIVDCMGLEDKRGIAVLMRGNSKFDSRAALRITEEYPHLSLALVASHVQDLVETIRERIAKDQEVVDELIRAAEAGGVQA